MTLFQGETRQEHPEGGPQQCQGVEEEIFLRLGRQLGVPFDHSSQGRGSANFEVMGSPSELRLRIILPLVFFALY